MSSLVFHLLCLAVIGYCQNPATHSNTVLDALSSNDSSSLLRAVFSFMSDDELESLYPITSRLPVSEMHNVSHWKTFTNNSIYEAVWTAISVLSEDFCSALDLSSSSCYSDCVDYNSLPSLLSLVIFGNDTDRLRSVSMLKWYAVSGTPISWYDVGNEDMCQYFEGTYCYTPSWSPLGVRVPHGCCVPGSCTGSDAVKMVRSNDWCFKIYEMEVSTLGAGSVNVVCDPIERDMAATNGWTTIVIFSLFLSCIVTASVLQRCWLEHSKAADTEMMDSIHSNAFIKVFNVQSIWSAFGRTRPTDKSTFNFLDGIRVWSMTWVCPYALSLSLWTNHNDLKANRLFVDRTGDHRAFLSVLANVGLQHFDLRTDEYPISESWALPLCSPGFLRDFH